MGGLYHDGRRPNLYCDPLEQRLWWHSRRGHPDLDEIIDQNATNLTRTAPLIDPLIKIFPPDRISLFREHAVGSLAEERLRFHQMPKAEIAGQDGQRKNTNDDLAMHPPRLHSQQRLVIALQSHYVCLGAKFADVQVIDTAQLDRDGH